MFMSTMNKGFQVTFANGHTVSVQWGTGNYCQARSYGGFGKEQKQDCWESATAEVAAWDKDNVWMKLGENDEVIGHQTPNEVLAIMNMVASL